MWPQRREGKARTKLVQRISCLEEGWGRGRMSCADAPGVLEERGAAWGCSEGVQKLVQRISCLGEGGAHEIGTGHAPSMWFQEGGVVLAREQGARGKFAQRISCFRLPPCVGMLLGGGRRARNWHSEFRAQRCSWLERGAAWGVLLASQNAHEIGTANFVLGGGPGKGIGGAGAEVFLVSVKRGELHVLEGGPGQGTGACGKFAQRISCFRLPP